MSQATRLGDKDTGHDACPPTGLITASSDVLINGMGAARVGDIYAPHGCSVHAAHSGAISSGSSTVFINGKPAARVGDSVSCGGAVAEGSPNVFIGG
nr:MAG TPA: Baseplate wedge protein [Caudoviricetes sp.]